jgi:disulfide oxidoreductase YuzD
MIRIPYNQIIVLANELDDQFMKAYLKNDFIGMDKYRTLYLDLLKGAGWTIQSFDQEMLERIDKDWDNIPLITIDQQIQKEVTWIKKQLLSCLNSFLLN